MATNKGIFRLTRRILQPDLAMVLAGTVDAHETSMMIIDGDEDTLLFDRTVVFDTNRKSLTVTGADVGGRRMYQRVRVDECGEPGHDVAGVSRAVQIALVPDTLKQLLAYSVVGDEFEIGWEPNDLGVPTIAVKRRQAAACAPSETLWPVPAAVTR